MRPETNVSKTLVVEPEDTINDLFRWMETHNMRKYDGIQFADRGTLFLENAHFQHYISENARQE
jgi:hypothetical protein